MASIGMLKIHNCMPYLNYDGSTKPGFSGAPYYSGNTVFGMHVGANNVNLAIDSTFIQAAILKSETPIFEERILREAKREGRKIRYKTYSDPDTIYVLSNGQYLAMDYNSLAEDLRAVLEYDVGPGQYDNENVHTTSDLRELSSEKLTFDSENVASTSLNLKGASALAEARQLRRVEVAPDLRRSQRGDQSPLKPLDTDGQELTAAQLKEALGSIVRLLKTQETLRPRSSELSGFARPSKPLVMAS
uniref:Serine protease n=1 Tax=Riboviria sp. TaxID=2585031 RepID=A0A8K1WSG9_9VIRU|nr:MAG: hypothetical protein 2 [Riboviria sp.]